ncbi:Fasciclin domain-containing protein [Mariniphaga anaerophila]|uniref:Fasciclin domain-containing protein n=1 Tax=Mariniphaga anaerophila TaxID=1484053 RepID=A0A1M4W2Q1_9BACT|nr:fasciclin domain-containing protein [Mariniphaga anaerophila]SHE75541.1 Fasciclin domain-containing protein [Mariniphaga anaerophila]
MIRSKIPILLTIGMALFVLSCRDYLDNKYERPDWLAGKVYSQILEHPELSTFAQCLELTGYDTIINVSGSYTVFAPSNEAFDSWFSKNPDFSRIDDVPADELQELVKYHIVQNAWSKQQLRSLDVFGWIDTLDLNNNKPRGFKRETLLKDDDRKYGWTQIGVRNKARPIIIDTLKAPMARRVITDSRKYAPVFFSEYLNIYDLKRDDYQFYFDRSFDGASELYYGNAKISSAEIFSENGFVYIVDQVVDPLRNAYQILEEGDGSESYAQFMDLVNHFPAFSYNQDETDKQPGAKEGLAVDSLFNLTFPELAFNLTSERTKAPAGVVGLPENVTYRYHHGMVAPTDDAFDELIETYIKIPNGWGTLDGAPDNIKRIIANTHLSINPVYPSDFSAGFYNGELDLVKLESSNIVHKEFSSNSTFIGLSKAIVPRAFSSVTGPVYLQQGFRNVMAAIERAGLLPALKRQNRDYMFFVESDANTRVDSSLVYNELNEVFSVFLISPGTTPQRFTLSQNDLRILLMSHVATKQPRGLARKEFLPNLAGSYIVVNNETGEVSGTAPTTRGYKGTSTVVEFPRILSSTADNGITYEVNNWFSFSVTSIYNRIQGNYPKFHALLQQAGLALDKQFRYSFLSDNEFYSIFVPSAQALDELDVSSLTQDELQKLLMLHFVQGELIFTDGSSSPGYFETTRVDEKSTSFSTVYTQLYVEPGIDYIRFKDKTGATYTQVEESEKTNLLTGVNLGESNDVFSNIFNNAVIHEIDRVLTFGDVDTQ